MELSPGVYGCSVNCQCSMTEDALSTVINFSKKLITFYNFERAHYSNATEDYLGKNSYSWKFY